MEFAFQPPHGLMTPTQYKRRSRRHANVDRMESLRLGVRRQPHRLIVSERVTLESGEFE
jgi:hypothetical protein